MRNAPFHSQTVNPVEQIKVSIIALPQSFVGGQGQVSFIASSRWETMIAKAWEYHKLKKLEEVLGAYTIYLNLVDESKCISGSNYQHLLKATLRLKSYEVEGNIS
jgi:hypothetical protein